MALKPEGLGGGGKTLITRPLRKLLFLRLPQREHRINIKQNTPVN